MCDYNRKGATPNAWNKKMTETPVDKRSKPATDGCFLPNFCSVRVVFAVVITAELLALILALSSSIVDTDFTSKLSLYSLFIQWVALSWAALICILRSRLQPLPDQYSGLVA